MQCVKNLDLRKYTTFGIGGIANTVYFPEGVDDLRFIAINNIPIIGGGSNMLIRDGGLEKLAILKRYDKHISVAGNVLKANSGAMTSSVLKCALIECLTGFEFMIGIPGLIGGAVTMNAGAFGHSISEVVRGVVVLDSNGKREYIRAEDLRFSRRYSIIQSENLIVEEVIIALDKANEDVVKSTISSYKAKRDKVIPSGKSAGGIFVNHQDLRGVDLSGLSVGEAYVSPMNNNFIINRGGASSYDVLSLIDKIRHKVERPLDLEIKILGR